MGANVFLAGLSKEKFGAQLSDDLLDVEYLYSDEKVIAMHSLDADLVIGAVLRVGQRAPHVITEAMIKNMGQGAVVVDVSIDQGGCIETSKPTTHNEPVFIKHGVIHYCVANMPGAYPRTATMALCAASIAYIHILVDKGLRNFMTQYKDAVNIHGANITNENVALNRVL